MTPSLRIMKGANVKGNPKKKRNKPKNICTILPIVSSSMSHLSVPTSIMDSSSSLENAMPTSIRVVYADPHEHRSNPNEHAHDKTVYHSQKDCALP